MSDAPYPLPGPKPPGLNGDWYRHLAAGTLVFQRCSDCGAWHHPPRLLCSACGSESWTWEPAAGTGEVFSWTVCHQSPLPDFAAIVPYAVLVVELDEGMRVVCSARGIENSVLRLGLPVELRIERVDSESALPYAVSVRESN